MNWPQRFLLNAQGPAEERLCLRKSALIIVLGGKVGEQQSNLGMFRTECFFTNGQCAQIERLGEGVTGQKPVKLLATQ